MGLKDRRREFFALAEAPPANIRALKDRGGRTRLHGDQPRLRAAVEQLASRLSQPTTITMASNHRAKSAAAKKAVWLAFKVKETLGLSAIKLALKVDAEWLCYANAVRQGKKGGGRARARRTYRWRQKSGR